MTLPLTVYDPLVRQALAEDIGTGDMTSAAIFGAGDRVKVTLSPRKDGVIAGLEIAAHVFRTIDPDLTIDPAIKDGDRVEAGQVIMCVEGSTLSVLQAERVALNFLTHLSGIATATRHMVDLIAHTKARLTCTRKTTPCLRALEKYAVRCGGGVNHRMGLYDAVMIKDNHIAACGGIAKALDKARHSVGHMVKIEIEVDRLDQLQEALACGAEVILLDNMSLDDLREAVAINKGRAVLEASGNVTVDTIKSIAETGVDMISSGAITHSAPQLDIGLDIMA